MSEPEGIHDKTLCYLTEAAQKAVSIMMEAGMERDLAVGVLEAIWDEEHIYEIPV